MTYMYEGIMILTGFACIIVIILIAVLVMAISNRNFVRIRDEANQKRYSEIKEAQDGLMKSVTDLIHSVKNLLPK